MLTDGTDKVVSLFARGGAMGIVELSDITARGDHDHVVGS